ncbi:MAG TPA: NUMOD4 motif-containing HNH endonuclease [Ferruginibacter sp.]|nr:NUMOD4 motif-containing HNH endonuclease [Ferruginibacter sp.]
MEEIIWKPVIGFERFYQISNTGKVVSFHKRNFNQEISQRIDRAGYLTVRLSKQGKTSTQYIHRLVALAYINILEDKPYVNHIDGDKLNNKVENLEWVTHAENIQHAYQIGAYSKAGLIIIDTCTGKSYNSIMQAAKALNISYSTCRYYLDGTIKKNKTCLEYKSFKPQILGKSVGIVN